MILYFGFGFGQAVRWRVGSSIFDVASRYYTSPFSRSPGRFRFSSLAGGVVVSHTPRPSIFASRACALKFAAASRFLHGRQLALALRHRLVVRHVNDGFRSPGGPIGDLLLLGRLRPLYSFFGFGHNTCRGPLDDCTLQHNTQGLTSLKLRDREQSGFQLLQAYLSGGAVDYSALNAYLSARPSTIQRLRPTCRAGRSTIQRL